MAPSPSSALPLSTSGASESHDRRSYLRSVARAIVCAPVVLGGGTRAAVADAETGFPEPKVTHTVFVDVRISRADGSFYVRDAAPSDAPDDEPVYAQVVLGLFGDAAPNHVKKFLSYVTEGQDVDNPLPSYSRSKFATLDSETGLLVGGTIPGLSVTTLGGGNALEYSGRIIPAKLWLEEDSAPPKLPHGGKGLLTHRNLDVTPAFGITTRADSAALDATHTVFGRVLEDGGGFLARVVDLPVLTDEGRVSTTERETATTAGRSVASSVFTAQRAVFRDAAKTFGDTRLAKTYDGKLLRRIEVTKVGVL